MFDGNPYAVKIDVAYFATEQEMFAYEKKKQPHLSYKEIQELKKTVKQEWNSLTQNKPGAWIVSSVSMLEQTNWFYSNIPFMRKFVKPCYESTGEVVLDLLAVDCQTTDAKEIIQQIRNDIANNGFDILGETALYATTHYYLKTAQKEYSSEKANPALEEFLQDAMEISDLLIQSLRQESPRILYDVYKSAEASFQKLNSKPSV